MALVVDGGKLVNKGSALGTGQACCCADEGFILCDESSLQFGGTCETGNDCDPSANGNGDADCPEDCQCKCVWCVGYYTFGEDGFRQDMTECCCGFTVVPPGFGLFSGTCHKVFGGDTCEAVENEVRPLLDAALGGQQGDAWDDIGEILSHCYDMNPLP